MRNLIRLSLLAAFSLTVFAQAEGHAHANAHDKRGLSDIIAAIEAAQGKKEDKAVTKTVTVQAAVAKGNATCAAQKTVTVTEQAAARTGAVGLQLSFLTTTVFGTGPPPTVTVTPLATFVTQLVTVTVGAAAAGISPPAGVNPPSGAVGSAGTGNAGSTSTPAATAASPAAAAVGSPGAMANGTGTLNPDGSCACSCLCGNGSFPNSPASAVAMSQSPASIVASTLQTIASSPTSSTVLSSSSSSSSSVAPAPKSAITSASSSSVVKSTVAPTSAASSLELSVTATSSSSGESPSYASSLELSLAATTTPAAQAAAAVAQQPADPIDISTYSLTSSLILGSLATATIKG